MKYDVTNFQKDVIEQSAQIPVLVDFWAEWCGPCKILGPILERLASEANGEWQLAKVDTEAMPEISSQYDIRSIPNVKLFVDGKVETEFTGALPEPMVKQWLQKNIPSKYRKDVERAEQLLASGKKDEAQPLLETVVGSEPGNHKARAILGRTVFFSDYKRAVALVEDIEEDSEVFEIADAIRTIASLLERTQSGFPEANVKQSYISAIEQLRTTHFAEAIESFIEIIREDRYYDDDGSRRACIGIFKLLGEENEITQRYRREFGSALY